MNDGVEKHLRGYGHGVFQGSVLTLAWTGWGESWKYLKQDNQCPSEDLNQAIHRNKSGTLILNHPVTSEDEGVPQHMQILMPYYRVSTQKHWKCIRTLRRGYSVNKIATITKQHHIHERILSEHRDKSSFNTRRIFYKPVTHTCKSTLPLTTKTDWTESSGLLWFRITVKIMNVLDSW
jgi:hypothetical protein